MSIRRTAIVLLSASLTAALSAPAVQAAQTPAGDDGLRAQHSLRAPVTDESLLLRHGGPIRKREHRQ